MNATEKINLAISHVWSAMEILQSDEIVNGAPLIKQAGSQAKNHLKETVWSLERAKRRNKKMKK